MRNPQLDAIKRRIEGFRKMAEHPYRIEAYDQCLELVRLAQEGRPL